MKKCPYCDEKIQDNAQKCRYCHEFIKNSKSSPAFSCGNCGGSVIKDQKKCKKCGSLLGWDDVEENDVDIDNSTPSMYKNSISRRLHLNHNRIGRLQFFLSSLKILLITSPLILLTVIQAMNADYTFFFSYTCLFVVGAIRNIRLFTLRLHDCNASGYIQIIYRISFILGFFMPFGSVLNSIFIILLWLIPGTTGRNQYGIPIK